MLNELRDLARSLDKDKIEQTSIQKYFRACPSITKKDGKTRKSMTFQLSINENGDLTDIQEVPISQVTTLRKWERSNGESFPAFNIPSLFKPTEEETTSLIKELKKEIKDGEEVISSDIDKILASCINAWTAIKKKKSESDRVGNCLDRVVSVEVEPQLGNVPDEYYSIKELCIRVKKMTAPLLHDQLKNILLSKLLDTPDSRFVDILFGTAKSQIVLELSDWAQKDYKYQASHREVQKWMNLRFLENEEKELKDEPEGIDAFGESSAGENQKFPEIRLKNALGKVIMRAMNRESPCQTRYGMIDAASFPAGNKVRKEMKKALEWLSDPVRQGKTWCDISNNIVDLSKKQNRNRRIVLFSYPTEMPELAPELAGLFGGADNNATDYEGVRFSAIAERVTSTLQGIAKGRPDVEVRIFVLAKMDKARTKVLVSKGYTAEHAVRSAEQWQAGCRNIPNINIRQFEDKMPVWKECLVPFPAEVVWCLNTAWRRQGTYAERVHGLSINDALSLLLDEGNEAIRLSQRAIDAIVRNCVSLILAMGQANASGRVFKINKKYEKQALLLPSILGLLLYKNGIEKGGFMNASAYLVGRFLCLADDLHLKYCQHVRKGSIPPQLVGNALMPTALETPEKALSMLSQRILPYQAWAKTLSDSEQDVGLVKYFLKQIGEVSNKLKEAGLSPTCSDTDKAQMLLGYLARSENN